MAVMAREAWTDERLDDLNRMIIQPFGGMIVTMALGFGGMIVALVTRA